MCSATWFSNESDSYVVGDDSCDAALLAGFEREQPEIISVNEQSIIREHFSINILPGYSIESLASQICAGASRRPLRPPVS